MGGRLHTGLLLASAGGSSPSSFITLMATNISYTIYNEYDNEICSDVHETPVFVTVVTVFLGMCCPHVKALCFSS